MNRTEIMNDVILTIVFQKTIVQALLEYHAVLSTPKDAAKANMVSGIDNVSGSGNGKRSKDQPRSAKIQKEDHTVNLKMQAFRSERVCDLVYVHCTAHRSL